eukprot:jgi/Chlat1/5728/Chrsp38S05566
MAGAADVDKRKAEDSGTGDGGLRKRRKWDEPAADSAAPAATNGAATAAPVAAPAAPLVDKTALLAKAKAALQKANALKARVQAGGVALKPAAAPAPAAAAAPPVASTPAAATAAPTIPPAQLQAIMAAMARGYKPTPEMMAAIAAMQPNLAKAAKPFRPPVLRVDAQGREIDEQGNVIEHKVAAVSTLKVNINKAKKEAFKIERPSEEELTTSTFFDPRMGIDKKALLRPKRSTFTFVEEGTFQKQAEAQRLRARFGDERARQEKLAKAADKRYGADEEDVNPNLIQLGSKVAPPKKREREPVPDVEWWDVALLPSGTYENIPSESDRTQDGAGPPLELNKDKITIYVEHPVPIEPPAEAAPPPPQPLMLTKKERKKMRKQRRLAREQEKQEMIRQGLLPPPKAKVKISNLMRVLGTDAVQDPTKMEKEVREQMAEREAAHHDRNLARKLTPAERKEKKNKKLFGEREQTYDTQVAVFRVEDLSRPQNRFKVDVNAQENRLTGAAVMCTESFTLVVVEGVAKSLKRYSNLMLRRIDWTATAEGAEEEEDEEAARKRRSNRCRLVWRGSVTKPAFKRFEIQTPRTEAAAHKFLSDKNVGHYWDLGKALPDEE